MIKIATPYLYMCICTESWLSEKVLKFAQQFSRPGKSLENRDKALKKKGKKAWVFFVEKLQQVFYKSIFFFVLVKSHSISPVRLQCIMERALFLHYFFIVSINHLFYNLDSGEKKNCFGKSLEKMLNLGS